MERVRGGKADSLGEALRTVCKRKGQWGVRTKTRRYSRYLTVSLTMISEKKEKTGKKKKEWQ